MSDKLTLLQYLTISALVVICSLIGVVLYSIVIVLALLYFYIKIVKVLVIESKKLIREPKRVK